MADIILINPKFKVSYWGMEHALPLLGKRANLPVACLPLLAALTPDGHTVTLIDENVEDIDWGRCARADIVGLTGMSVQRFRMKEILAELKRRGCFTVVGGPYVTVEEGYFGDDADVIFVGEAEVTWPRFLEEWHRGVHGPRYEQAEKTDMGRVPTPRFDLLKMRHYAFGSVQFSRGCPFQCEFCDIIVTFGRKPRIKTSGQILAELEAIRAQKQRIVFIVDDNLIGNKAAIKAVLREVAAWQEANGFPLAFTTEASIDLADDPELLALMVEANIVSVFVGIESPNEASLRETKKYQNVRAGGTMLEKVRRIQDAGLEVWCGMILGFDNDDATIFEAQQEFIRDARIPTTMIGMLNAIPKTPLHARLEREGRLLDWSEESSYGTNIVPLKMSREELRDGYVRSMNALYEPSAYFDRLDDLLLGGDFPVAGAWMRHWARHPWRRLRDQAELMALALGLFALLMLRVPDAALRREYRRRLWGLLRIRREPTVVVSYVVKCAMHYHAHTMARDMAGGRSPIYNSG
ncbi:Radical SAM superfamily protein [Aquisphaera giovannonii]|uniref:Radical SAM superfamily protein n=1 Tax=Aquisphaera giovannonii TaxID=406548 RepID=A0A5B9VTW0_9BACT|nr:B12-binding domain-containing radical SAM protein [Aquisphaera giovannonii]QEH31742.1 Radical SAM superfamily protein [Aquisphaera giovannonii]